jgi:hypothetical protein
MEEAASILLIISIVLTALAVTALEEGKAGCARGPARAVGMIPGRWPGRQRRPSP